MIKKTLLATAVIGGQWNGPLEIFTVDHAPSHVACNGNSAG